MEGLTVGRGQVLFVGRDALEQVDGVGRAVVVEGVLGQPQLLGGGAAAFERHGIVLQQAGEFLLFGLREGGLAGDRVLQEGRGTLVVAVALGLDGVAQRPGGLGAEELGDARRRPTPGRRPGATPAKRPTTRMNPVPAFALATMASFELRPVPLEATPKRRQLLPPIACTRTPPASPDGPFLGPNHHRPRTLLVLRAGGRKTFSL